MPVSTGRTEAARGGGCGIISREKKKKALHEVFLLRQICVKDGGREKMRRSGVKGRGLSGY